MQASNASRLRLAQARIGAVHLGIPAACVVQAIPVPDSLSLLPLRGKALRGVIEHGGVLVPVVDLARWVDVGSAASVPGDGARILVLREGGRTIGLQVDALGGLLDAPADEVRRLHHGDDPEDVFHSAVRTPDSGIILSLLEVDRLADLALAWSAELPAARTSAGEAVKAGEAAAPETRLYAVLDTGRGLLGVLPADLAEVITMPSLELLGGGATSTWCTWRGRHLAVLPGATLMGGEAAEDSAPLLAIFTQAGLALGVPVRGVLQLRGFSAGLEKPGGLTATVHDAEHGEVQLLDTARLFARYPEAALSQAEHAGGPAAGAGADAANADAYIVFEADGMQAVPIGAVEHILPQAASSGASDSMPWRGGAIPLVDLRAQGPARAAPGHVLVAGGPQGPAGYVVTRVSSLIPAGAGSLYRMGAGRQVEFITAGEGTEQASYRIVALADCA
jgi:chemotaxis signal transduction protein